MKNSFYFQHDINASGDDKLLAIREKFKWEGVGLFWAILEAMARSEGYINPSLMGGLSLAYGVDKNLLKSLLDFCVEIELFSKDIRGFYSGRMIEQLEYRKMLSESGKRGVRIREARRGALCQNQGGLHAGQDRTGKERKGKKINNNNVVEKNLLKYLSEFATIQNPVAYAKSILQKYPAALIEKAMKNSNCTGPSKIIDLCETYLQLKNYS